MKLDRDRTNLLLRKAARGVTKGKGEKYTEKDVQKKWIKFSLIQILIYFYNKNI